MYSTLAPGPSTRKSMSTRGIKTVKAIGSWLRKDLLNFLIFVVYSAYHLLVRPFLQGQCRFNPSCAFYAKEIFGLVSFHKACFLILKRLGKCHPWGNLEEVVDLDLLRHAPQNQEGACKNIKIS